MTYNEFINNIISTRGQWNIPNGKYYEVHHIIPRCLGGKPEVWKKTTKDSTLIWLYPEEHYEAHKLLFLENKSNYGLYKISNGKNGHASIRYFYKDLQFDSRKELLEYLNSIDIKITSSAIRKVVHNTGTLRVYNMYKDVFDNLRWEFKDENSQY